MLYNINYLLKNLKFIFKVIFLKKLVIFYLFKEFIIDKYKEVNCNVSKLYIMYFIYIEFLK